MKEETTARGRVDVYADHAPEVKIRSKKMMMWLVIFAVVMLFGGLTSAYIVMNSGKYWVHVYPPGEFWASNVLIALSSLTIYFALRQIKAGRNRHAALLIGLTLLLGVGFAVAQTRGWKALASLGMGYTVTDTGQGRVHRWNAIEEIKAEYGTDYYITLRRQVLEKRGNEFYMPGIDKPVTDDLRASNMSASFIFILIFIHIFHLVLGLIYLVVLLYRALQGILSPQNWISLYTGGMYWHFLGILWLYLFFFLFY